MRRGRSRRGRGGRAAVMGHAASRGGGVAAQPFVRVRAPGFFPPMTTEEMWSMAVPELVTVTVTGPLVVPCVVVGKEMLPGTRVTAGWGGGGATPVPLS